MSVSWEDSGGHGEGSTGWWLMSARQGTAFVEAGQYRAGLEYMWKALREVRADGDRFNEVAVLSLVADAYARLGQYEQWLNYLTEARDLARKIGATANEGAILEKMGEAYYALGDNESAVKSFAAALPLLKQSGQLLYTAPALFGNFANVLAAEGMYEEALELYDKALEAPLVQPGNKVGILFSKGNVRFLQKDYAAALQFYEEALILAQKLSYPALPAAPLMGVGTVYEKQGRLEEALAYFERSIGIQEKVVAAAGPRQFKSSLAEQSAAVYRRAVPLTLRIGQDRKAFELSERARARAFLDQMAAGRLAGNGVEKMQQIDSLRWKLIELKRELNQGRPGRPHEEDEQALKRVREQIASTQQSLKSAVDELPDGMLILNAMASAETASLPDVQEALDADTTLLAYLKSSADIGRRALIMVQHDVEGFTKLTFAPQEARAIAELYRTEPLSGSQATETAFRVRAGQADIIHLAAHGELNPVQPLFSRILFGKDGINDGSLEVHEVYGLDLKEADLVVLSACDTQLGPLSRGDDFVGLSRAFLAAGAPAVVATLWPVDDEATGLLMTRFYSNRNDGLGAAAALAAAQRATRAKYPHPYYWAGFILTADPGGPE